MTPAIAREEVSVLIPAAGQGERLGMGPKAMLALAGRPLVDWVADKAHRIGAEVLVACAPGMPAPAGTLRVEGCAVRQDTVAALAARASLPWCVVWDAASPFASIALAQRVLAAAATQGAALPVLHGATRWFETRDGLALRSHDGGFAGGSQTPQAYATALLRELTVRATAEGWQSQSTADLVLLAGLPLAAVPGERLNLKLTTPDDWVLAQALHARLQS